LLQPKLHLEKVLQLIKGMQKNGTIAKGDEQYINEQYIKRIEVELLNLDKKSRSELRRFRALTEK